MTLAYWSWLTTLFAEFAPEISALLRPPASAEQIAALASALGRPVPEEVATAWRQHDGTVNGQEGPVLTRVADDPSRIMNFLSADAMVSAAALLQERWQWWRLPGDVSSWLPFAGQLEESTFVCIEMAGPGAGRVHEVELDEVDNVTEVAPTLAAWFERYAAALAAANGYRFVDGAVVYIAEAAVLQIVKLDEHEVHAESPVGQGYGGAVFRAGVTRFDPGYVAARGDVLRCKVALGPRVATSAALVEHAASRVARAEVALAPWRSAGFELSEVTVDDVLALPWHDADAAAACWFAAHAPVFRNARWGPGIGRETYERLRERAAVWGVPTDRVEVDVDAALDTARALAATPAGHGRSFVFVGALVFDAFNRALAAAGDERYFAQVETADHRLAGDWILLDAAQEQRLHAEGTLRLVRPESLLPR